MKIETFWALKWQQAKVSVIPELFFREAVRILWAIFSLSVSQPQSYFGEMYKFILSTNTP
jgi:hypothetical protein